MAPIEFCVVQSYALINIRISSFPGEFIFINSVKHFTINDAAVTHIIPVFDTLSRVMSSIFKEEIISDLSSACVGL